MIDAHDQLPSYDRVVLPAPPLEMCLVQVKYPPLARFAEPGYLNALKEALGEEYPLASVEQTVSLVVTPQGITPTSGEFLRFTSIDYSWSIVLSPEAVALENRRYSAIDEFAARFEMILRLIATHLHPRYQLRFGLRYINELRHPRGTTYEGWRLLLGHNPALLGLGARNMLGGTIEQTIGELRTRRSDGTLLLRHGFLQGTTVSPMGGAQPKTGPFYLLDLDYSDEAAVVFDPAQQERMRSYNAFLYRIFRWCVGEDELYGFLGG